MFSQKYIFGLLFFPRLFVPLTSSKVLSLDKTKNNFFTCYNF